MSIIFSTKDSPAFYHNVRAATPEIAYGRSNYKSTSMEADQNISALSIVKSNPGQVIVPERNIDCLCHNKKTKIINSNALR